MRLRKIYEGVQPMRRLSLLIVVAWFVCFKCGLKKDIHTVVLGSSLVYFNPVVITATSGNLPDVYIALIGVLIFFLIRKCQEDSDQKHAALNGVFAGLLLLAGLFAKETIVLIYAGTAIMLFYCRHKISRHFLIALITIFFIGSAGYLYACYVHTGNAFYRFVQINNSVYFNPCSYNCLPKLALLKRLTITVPLNAAIAGAFPLLMVLPLLFWYRQYKSADALFWKITLVSLCMLALYFPFSLSPYVPLCHDMRQFFFLFPIAAVLYLYFLQSVSLSAQSFRQESTISGIVFAITIALALFYTPFNKWYILCCSLLAGLFIINIFLSKKQQQFTFYFIVPVILWFSVAYPLYKKPHTGYASLKAVYGKLKQDADTSNTFYFLNNDTRSHFALINKFNTGKQFFNLDTIQKGFKPFIAYQPKNIAGTATFKKGWLIVSDQYPENMNTAQIQSINKLLAQIPLHFEINKTRIYYITTVEALQQIIHAVNIQTANTGCN